MDNIIINLDDSIRLGGDPLPNITPQSDIISQSDAIVGPAGQQGPQGPAGKDGEAATITVGSTTTGAAGTNALVQNSGTSSAAVLEFTIPRGDKGETGEQGPKGETGAAGADGEAATITVGSVTTVSSEYPATVTNSGTTSAAVLDFQIPQGIQGETGPAGADGRDGTDGRDGVDGQAATITVGSTTTGAAGTNASVTNSGTSSAAVLEFTIPRGDTGAAGSDGTDGYSPTATVTQNTGSATISITDKNGTTTATVYDGVTPDTTVTSYSIDNTPAHSGGTNSYMLKKQLNVVSLNVDAIWINSLTTSWTNIGTIPSAIRPSTIVPSTAVYANGVDGSIVGFGKIQVMTDGTVRTRANSAQTSLRAIGFSVTWII